MRFYSSLGALQDDRGGITCAHATENAWARMELDGVVAIGNSPGVYIKETQTFDPVAEDELHRKLWLHATAPLLIVIDPSRVRVYSSRPKVTKDSRQTFIEVLSRATDALQVYNLLQRVQGGEYFEANKDHFYPRYAVDSHFRRQLEATRDILQKVDQRIGATKIHSLLVYAILLRYLQDRGLLDEVFFQRHAGFSAGSLYDFLNGSSDLRGAFSSIYKALSLAFNFDELLEAHELITNGPFRNEHFQHVSDFLCGHSVGTGQLALGTWKYDLSLLPVELISAVYQEFLSSEVDNAKRSIGLVATPRHLAEVVLDIAFENCKLEEPRILDPACGSGIFLVGCFNRLASNWRTRYPHAEPLEKLRALKSLLQNNIIGVELQQTACKLAELNLLHALLSHFQNHELGHIVNRRHLRRSSGLQATTTIIQGNYLQTTLPHDFDIIIGNPPWSNDPSAFGNDWPSEWPVPERGNLTYGYSWKVLENLADNGTATLLLDGKAMLSSPPAKEFATSWFREANIDTIVNFADLRSYLFEGKAGRPAALFRFGPSLEGDSASKRIRYITPMRNSAGRRGGLLSLSGSRVQLVRYSEVTHCAAIGDHALCRMWRVRLYGSGRDIRLVERLAELGNLKQLLAHAGGGYHQGFNRRGTSAPPLTRPLLHEIPFLPTSTPQKWRCRIDASSRLLRAYGEAENETDRVQQWPSDAKRLFFGPRVVLHHTPVHHPPFLQAAYTEAPFSFHKEIHAIYINSASSSFHKFLAAVLSSRLAFYFMFQTSLSWGVEAIPQLRNVDVLNLPFPDFREDKSDIIEEVAELIDRVDMSSPTTEVEDRINALVFDYYEVDDWERDIVDDAVVAVAPGALTNEVVSWSTAMRLEDARRYLMRLSEVLAEWLVGPRGSQRAYLPTVSSGTGVILLSRVGNGIEVLAADRELDGALGRLRSVLSSSRRTKLTQNVMLFAGDDLYLTKAMDRRNWTRAAAMDDADHVISALLKEHRSH